MGDLMSTPQYQISRTQYLRFMRLFIELSIGLLADYFQATHIGPQHFGYNHCTIRLLEVFKDGDQDTRQGEP